MNLYELMAALDSAERALLDKDDTRNAELLRNLLLDLRYDRVQLVSSNTDPKLLDATKQLFEIALTLHRRMLDAPTLPGPVKIYRRDFEDLCDALRTAGWICGSGSRSPEREPACSPTAACCCAAAAMTSRPISG